MNTASTISFLENRVGQFRSFSATQLQTLVQGSRIRAFEANEIVMHQGDEATHFGVVLSGALQASVAGDGGARHFLGQLKAGDTFNDLAL